MEHTVVMPGCFKHIKLSFNPSISQLKTGKLVGVYGSASDGMVYGCFVTDEVTVMSKEVMRHHASANRKWRATATWLACGGFNPEYFW